MKIRFFEKPGCTNNTKQKKMLTEAGHEVEAISLLTYPWTTDYLRPFFGSKPVAQWFNLAAPDIKSGEIDPEKFTEETALIAMIKEPLLIKRPLVETDTDRVSGFDNDVIDMLINYQDTTGLHSCSNFLNRCS